MKGLPVSVCSGAHPRTSPGRSKGLVGTRVRMHTAKKTQKGQLTVGTPVSVAPVQHENKVYDTSETSITCRNTV